MATVKVKFRKSSVEGKAGTIYYQLCHKQSNRQITPPMRILHWWEQKKKHSVSGMDETKETGPMGVYTIPARTVCTVREALDANKGRIPLEESAGRTAGEFVYIYPPEIL